MTMGTLLQQQLAKHDLRFWKIWQDMDVEMLYMKGHMFLIMGIQIWKNSSLLREWCFALSQLRQ